MSLIIGFVVGMIGVTLVLVGMTILLSEDDGRFSGFFCSMAGAIVVAEAVSIFVGASK